MSKKTWTVLEIIDWSRQHLAEKGFENSRLETELLLGHALSLPRIELYLNYERQLKVDELERYTDDSTWPLPKYREMLWIY